MKSIRETVGLFTQHNATMPAKYVLHMVLELEEAIGILQAQCDASDVQLTRIRVLLSAAGMPDAEPYPDEHVTEWERSLRCGGRAISTAARVERLIAERDARPAIAREDVRLIRGATLHMKSDSGQEAHAALYRIFKALNDHGWSGKGFSE